VGLGEKFTENAKNATTCVVVVKKSRLRRLRAAPGGSNQLKKTLREFHELSRIWMVCVTRASAGKQQEMILCQ
jgi:hypothetical protein